MATVMYAADDSWHPPGRPNRRADWWCKARSRGSWGSSGSGRRSTFADLDFGLRFNSSVGNGMNVRACVLVIIEGRKRGKCGGVWGARK